MRKYLLIACLPGLFLSACAASPLPSVPPTPAWKDRVFYEVFVRSFYDSNGDGIGDLAGLTEKLDYLNDGDSATTSDLGVTGLWLMPITEAYSYHGYDVTDYQAVEHDYGSTDDFRTLISEAHKRDIIVIIDLVLNHTSSHHPWFVESTGTNSEYRDWYVWRDQDPGYLGPWNENVWHEYNSSYYYGIFWSEMPDLNYENPTVTTAMIDVAHFWLTEMGADGFRLDGARHIIEEGEKQANTDATHAWLKDFRAAIQQTKPDTLVVGEIWDSSIVVAPYVGDQVDLAFEFELAGAMMNAVDGGNKNYLEYTQEQVSNLYPPGQMAVFLTNHDQNRVLSELGGKVDAARAAAVLLLTNPGVPFIYYGEEIGMQGSKPDEFIRRPMLWDSTPRTAGFTSGSPWQPLDDDPEARTVSDQLADPESLLNTYRTLIHLRATHPALRGTTLIQVESNSPAIYAYVRTVEDETLLIVVNLSNKPVSDYALTLADASMPSIQSASLLFGKGQITNLAVNEANGFEDYRPLSELPPYAALIVLLEQ